MKRLISALIIFSIACCMVSTQVLDSKAYSEDDIVWTENTGVTENSLWDITYSKGIYVAVGDKGTILTSPDAVNWTKRESGTTCPILCITWGNNMFVAAGLEGLILTSTDGIAWSKQQLEFRIWPNDIVWNGSLFVILAQDDMILTSKDGFDWHPVFVNDFSYFNYHTYLCNIKWDGTRFWVSMGNGSFITSPDGVTWSKPEYVGQDPYIGALWGANSTAWGNGRFVSIGNPILISADGVSWEKINTDMRLSVLIWDGSRFVSIGYDGKTYTSVDGKRWASGVSSIGEFDLDRIWWGTLWNGEKYVIVTEKGSIFTASPKSVIKVKVDGNPIVFDIAPTTIQNRTMVPLRGIFEVLGAKVEWDGKTKTITATKGNTRIVLKVDSKDATVNGKKLTLDVAATIINGRTFVPTRFIAESLGTNVDWDGDTRTVLIMSK